MNRLLFSLLLLLMGYTASAQQPAFPTAEGYGMFAKGGRGGDVYEVTNLDDSGPGSLRAAVEAAGPRTVVFRVSGTIQLESALRVTNPYLTIAGQTAPGDGICLSHYPLMINADNVIIRYLRVRVGDVSGDDTDAISSRFTKHLILDHVSASWSIDETMSIYHCDSVTVQWSIISESLYNSNHVKGQHGYGGIWGCNYSTYHHNLLAHHTSRNPRFASGSGFTDYRNNVVYNWGYNSTYGGEAAQKDDPRYVFSSINMVANYYKPGPATKEGQVAYRIANPSSRIGTEDYGRWYIAGNIVEGNETVSADNWAGGVQPQQADDVTVLRLSAPWPALPIQQETAQEAYASVLAQAGATLPRRDLVDARIVHDTRTGTATYAGPTYERKPGELTAAPASGIIDSQNDVGGWPELISLPAPRDTDHDGMPDYWEEAHGLDKTDAADRNKVAEHGYTMLEVYLNGI